MASARSRTAFQVSDGSPCPRPLLLEWGGEPGRSNTGERSVRSFQLIRLCCGNMAKSLQATGPPARAEAISTGRRHGAERLHSPCTLHFHIVRPSVRRDTVGGLSLVQREDGTRCK